MASVSVVNPKADVLRRAAALGANCNAARGLMEILKTNLGPQGTLKMLVSGAGLIKMTKDGSVLLSEMQIQHPTASMIARAATAQDAITGDGTTSTVLLIGELMKLAERVLADGVHPRLICEGFDLARSQMLKYIDELSVPVDVKSREALQGVARTALLTKLNPELALQLTDIVLDAVAIISDESSNEGRTEIDLFRVEVLHMRQQFSTSTRLVRGLVMDHGARHPDMPRKLTNCFVLTLNVSLEYEKTEVNSSFFYSSAEHREKLVAAERAFTDDKVGKIIALKRQVCTEENKCTFAVFNQKGIDPASLEILAKDGVFALRRVKRRNMERITLACGGEALNCVDELTTSDLGFAGIITEEAIGDEKWTFVEDVKNPKSCTVLIKGPNDHTIAQVKDAVRDGLRAVKNTIEDKRVIVGAGAFEVACHCKLLEYCRKTVVGKQKLGVQIFAEALLIIPKTLAANFGLDSQETVLNLIDMYEKDNRLVGVVPKGEDPGALAQRGIFDNYCVKRQMLSLAPTLAQQLLLCDEIIRAGKSMGNNN